MRRSGHSGTHTTGCPNCITAAEKMKMPWHSSYHDIMAHPTYGPALERKHNAAIRRGIKSGKVKFLVPLVLAGLVATAHAATKPCPSGTLTASPLTTTGPTADVVVPRGSTAFLIQTIRTAGTATVALELSCDGTNWAAVQSGSVSVDGTTTSGAVSVVSPVCTYRANVTACSSCSVTVLYACAGS